MNGFPLVPRPAHASLRLARPLLVTALLGLLLAACTPKLNWRSASVPDASLQVLLPCDPDTARRPIEMGLGVVQMAMMGCDADYATYAVSHFWIADASQAAETLSYWQAAVLGQLHAPAAVPGQASGAKLLHGKGDGAFVPKGALNIPQSLRISFSGKGPQGWNMTAHGVWFAHVQDGGARLYHAVVYSDKPKALEADTFFAGLQLR